MCILYSRAETPFLPVGYILAVSWKACWKSREESAATFWSSLMETCRACMTCLEGTPGAQDSRTQQEEKHHGMATTSCRVGYYSWLKLRTMVLQGAVNSFATHLLVVAAIVMIHVFGSWLVTKNTFCEIMMGCLRSRHRVILMFLYHHPAVRLSVAALMLV